MPSVVLFGCGSPVIVDVQESCRRKGVKIAAVIKNAEGQDYQIGIEATKVADADPSVFHASLAIPLFTPAYRQSALAEASKLGATNFPSLVDPTAILPSAIEIGDGVYINAGVTIGAASRLGRFSFVNRSASLGHHIDLRAFASIAPGVVTGGQVTIGRGAVIGIGTVLLPGVSVGDNSVVAAGSVVSRDLPSNVLAAGNPARIIRRDIAGYNGLSVDA